MRSPLNAVSLALQILQLKLPEQDLPQLSRAVKQALRYLAEMNDFSHQFQDFVKSSASLDEDAPHAVVELGALVQEIAAVHPVSAVTYEEPLPAVYGSDHLVRRVLQNLVTNGLKYNRALEPRVNITARATASEVQVNVRDNGIGVAPELRERIFAPFERAEAASFQGSGLGLAITHHLVDLMEGAIEVQSAKGEGTTFTMTLPLEARDRDQAPEP